MQILSPDEGKMDGPLVGDPPHFVVVLDFKVGVSLVSGCEDFKKCEMSHMTHMSAGNKVYWIC